MATIIATIIITITPKIKNKSLVQEKVGVVKVDTYNIVINHNIFSIVFIKKIYLQLKFHLKMNY